MVKKIVQTLGAHTSPFERIRNINDACNEYWESRDLAEGRRVLLREEMRRHKIIRVKKDNSRGDAVSRSEEEIVKNPLSASASLRENEEMTWMLSCLSANRALIPPENIYIAEQNRRNGMTIS